jgi:hypothetical protein
MANEKTEQEKAAEKAAADKLAADEKAAKKAAADKLAADEKAAKKAAAAAPSFPELKIGESSGNLTRDSIIEFQRGKHVEQGKDEAEAQRLAVKRGYEMIKD